jgi:hypothetical protein
MMQGSRKQDSSIAGREEKPELGLVSQEEFQSEQNRDEGARWVASRKLAE